MSSQSEKNKTVFEVFDSSGIDKEIIPKLLRFGPQTTADHKTWRRYESNPWIFSSKQPRGELLSVFLPSQCKNCKTTHYVWRYPVEELSKIPPEFFDFELKGSDDMFVDGWFGVLKEDKKSVHHSVINTIMEKSINLYVRLYKIDDALWEKVEAEMPGVITRNSSDFYYIEYYRKMTDDRIYFATTETLII